MCILPPEILHSPRFMMDVVFLPPPRVPPPAPGSTTRSADLTERLTSMTVNSKMNVAAGKVLHIVYMIINAINNNIP